MSSAMHARSGAVLLAIALVPATLIGQQRWAHQVEARLTRVIDALPRSSRPSIVRRSGMLNADEGASFQTTLVQRVSYVIIAVCDDDCSRLQMTLVSASGSEIAKERNSESLPTLRFTPDTTTGYGIRIVMEGCRWNPCWYAVAVVPLGKNSP